MFLFLLIVLILVFDIHYEVATWLYIEEGSSKFDWGQVLSFGMGIGGQPLNLIFLG